MHVDVNADCLAALLVLDRELELVPEPFRMQPDVQIYINLEEYVKFVQSLPADSTLLNSQTHRICEAISVHDDELLLRSFYTDIALAVGKELFFAESFGKSATTVRHTFYNCNADKSVVIEAKCGDMLRHLLSVKGFSLPTALSNANLVHWNYACKLIQDASKVPTRWVEKH